MTCPARKAVLFGFASAAAIAVLGSQGAKAELGPDRFAGAWSLEGASEGMVNCPLSLGRDVAIGGYAVTVSPACRRAYPWTADVMAWHPSLKDGVVLVDGTRHAIVAFERDSGDDYTGTATDKATYVLYPKKKIPKPKP